MNLLSRFWHWLCGPTEEDQPDRYELLERRCDGLSQMIRQQEAELDKLNTDLNDHMLVMGRIENAGKATARDLTKSIHTQHEALQTLTSRQKIQADELNKLYDWAGRLHEFLRGKFDKEYLVCNSSPLRPMEVDGT